MLRRLGFPATVFVLGHEYLHTRELGQMHFDGIVEFKFALVPEHHQRRFEAGYVPADRDVEEFARALRAVGEPMFGMDASRISMGKLLSYLFEVTERFGMETRTELILLQRTMVVVEGVARSLSPQLNIWDVAHPIVEDYIKNALGPRALMNDLVKTLRVVARFGPRLPNLVEKALEAQAASAVAPPPSRLGLKIATTAILSASCAGLAAYLLLS